jgi:hypothetical protein
MSKAIKKAEKTEDLLVGFEGSREEGHNIHLTCEDSLQKIFNTTDKFQGAAFLTQCLRALSDIESGDNETNDQRSFMLAVIHEMAPKDPIERMLAVQMAATHMATIRTANSLAHSNTLEMREINGNGFNKLARTFTAQMEALRKHRNGGKQTVTVQHVNVEDGGQAIVGNVAQGGGKDEK